MAALTEGQAAAIIRASPDPLKDHNSSSSPKLTCKKVQRVFDADPRDQIVEVLYLDGDNQPVTAYLRDDLVVSIADGW